MTYSSLNEIPSLPGRYRLHLPVATELSGMEVGINAIVHVGASDGPTLTTLSGLHGNEWLQLDFFRALDAEVDHGQLKGRLILIPVANAVAFGSLTRNILDDSDAPDMNRLFPVGPRPQNGLAEQLAAVLAHEVLAQSNALLDFHLGIWGSTLGSSIVGTDYSDESISAASFELALVFGVPLVFAVKMMSVFPGPRSAQSYSGEVLKIPSCGSFLGGAGFDRDLEEEWAQRNLQGIRNVMIHMGMMSGETEKPSRYLVYDMVQRINPKNGGYLVPIRDRDEFGREVEEGELLGYILSPFSLEPIEELRSPMDGYLAYWARRYPVRVGDWAFSVVPKDHLGTRWIEAELES